MKKFFLVVLQALHLIASDAKKVIAVALEITGKALSLLQLPVIDNVMAIISPELSALIPGIEKALSQAITAMNSAEANVNVLTVVGETDVEKIEAQLQAFLLAWKQETPLVQKAIMEKLATILTQILAADSSETSTGAIVAAAIAKSKEATI